LFVIPFRKIWARFALKLGSIHVRIAGTAGEYTSNFQATSGRLRAGVGSGIRCSDAASELSAWCYTTKDTIRETPSF
jgi:hypothetical protein